MVMVKNGLWLTDYPVKKVNYSVNFLIKLLRGHINTSYTIEWLCSFKKYFFIMKTCKKIKPINHMFQFAFLFSAGKIVIKALDSIFYMLYRPFYNAFLIKRMKMMIQFQKSTCL